MRGTDSRKYKDGSFIMVICRGMNEDEIGQYFENKYKSQAPSRDYFEGDVDMGLSLSVK